MKGTEFTDNEFCVYADNQHTMSYLVEFKPSPLGARRARVVVTAAPRGGPDRRADC